MTDSLYSELFGLLILFRFVANFLPRGYSELKGLNLSGVLPAEFGNVTHLKEM